MFVVCKGAYEFGEFVTEEIIGIYDRRELAEEAVDILEDNGLDEYEFIKIVSIEKNVLPTEVK